MRNTEIIVEYNSAMKIKEEEEKQTYKKKIYSCPTCHKIVNLKINTDSSISISCDDCLLGKDKITMEEYIKEIQKENPIEDCQTQH